MNRKQRMKNRANAARLYLLAPPRVFCPNCKEYDHTGHYFPPCFGDPGFYVCIDAALELAFPNVEGSTDPEATPTQA